MPRKKKPVPGLVRDRLSQSNAIDYALALRGRYDLDAIKQQVMQTWEGKS